MRKDGTHPRLSRDHILESVYGSLERMDTDYIVMLYLGDWPDRCVHLLSVGWLVGWLVGWFVVFHLFIFLSSGGLIKVNVGRFNGMFGLVVRLFC